MPRPKKYPDELMDRGVRLVFESKRPIAHVAADLGIHPETLRKRVRQAEADNGTRPALLTSEEREEIRKLRRDVHDLRRRPARPATASHRMGADRPSRSTGRGSARCGDVRTAPRC
jgi:transposase